MNLHSSSQWSRRGFIKAGGLSAAALALASHTGCATTPPLRKGRLVETGRKLNLACVGCGGKGISDVAGVSSENIIALCDVDDEEARVNFERHPEAARYRDYRVMLEELDDRIDGVVVSTPDHMHHVIGMAAIERGKHVFIQKPLARSIGEVRDLTLAARRHEVISQMGNQGHASEGVRLVREWVQGNVIGGVREVHVWTEKLRVSAYKSGLTDRPPAGEAIPPSLDWNLWLGTAPVRAYSAEYHPKKWRGWWDFGCGALGDIGCHTMDAAFYALDLGAPESVQAETGPFTDEVFPAWSVITYKFPARGSMPPVTLYWYDGGKVPPRPPGMEPGRNFEEHHGYYLVGDKGVIYDPTEKCKSPRLVPESRMRETRFPAKTIPRVPKGDPFMEWINACKGGPIPGSNFDYAGPLSEMVLLGNMAIRARGKAIQWDAEAMRIANAPELNRYLLPATRAF